jgi:hypothetical protein
MQGKQVAVRARSREGICRGVIPAPSLEKVVTERILGFLNAPSELLAVLKDNLLDAENAPPCGFYLAVVERATKMVKSWKPRPAPDRDHFLKAVIDRIVVQAEHIEIRLRLAAILNELLGSDTAGQASKPQSNSFRLLP